MIHTAGSTRTTGSELNGLESSSPSHSGKDAAPSDRAVGSSPSTRHPASDGPTGPVAVATPDARAEALTRANRTSSGWNTAEVVTPEIDAEKARAAREAPLLPEAPFSEATDSPRQRRTRNYEIAQTVSVSREMLQDYMAAAIKSAEETAEAAAAEEAALEDASRPVPAPVKHVAPSPAREVQLKPLPHNSPLPLLIIALLFGGLGLMGWLVAREWPTDIAPSVKAFVDSPAHAQHQPAHPGVASSPAVVGAEVAAEAPAP